MANRVDVGALRGSVLMSSIVGRFVELKKSGAEWKGLCPFHEERTPSFTVNDEKQLFCCFGCEAKGDVIDFVAKREGLDFKAAVARVADLAGSPAAPTQATKKDKVPILPVPADAPQPSFRHARHGEPSRVWTYQNERGQPLGYVCRFDMSGGHKEIVPRCYTSEGWKWVSMPKPRPLYGLELLAQRPAAGVVVVEGEKSADAARALIPQAVVVTWAGGSKAVKHADWKPLAGRKVVLWPDTDEPGRKAMDDLAELLGDVAAGIRIAEPPEGKDKGWDAADAAAEGWTAESTKVWLSTSMREPSRVTVEELPLDEAPPPEDFEPSGFEPFQCLGHDHGTYYYLSRGARQVTPLTGPGHTKGGLLMLAPLQYWEREHPSKGGANWDAAANKMMRACERVGIYDPKRVRGRGAWWDEKTSVLHLGDRLVIDGQDCDLAERKSRYIYEAAAPIRINSTNPLTPREAVGLEELCKLLSWEKPIQAQLLAGWCVIAPICGALRWRPHIWVTGPAGVGKSWVYENILARCLGDIAIACASETTEAGLRQALGSDARPVIFDEAEGETGKAQQRIQNVLALMRQASSETSAAIYKGSATGEGQRYITRSCFAFSSIGVGLQQHADQTRVTVLSLVVDPRKTKEEKSAHFSNVVEPKWLATLTPEFIERLHARTVSLIPVIRKNAETFAVAGASVIGTRRLGDQLGALIAGAYSLHSNKEISLDEARAWLARQDWSEEAQIQEQRDEVSCLNHLLQHVVAVQTEKGRHDRSLGELVRIVTAFNQDVKDLHVFPAVAQETLHRYGLRVEDNLLHVAHNHTGLAKILANTSWGRNWKLILRRLPGAFVAEARRFGGSTPDRAVAIPIPAIFGEPAPSVLVSAG